MNSLLIHKDRHQLSADSHTTFECVTEEKKTCMVQQLCDTIWSLLYTLGYSAPQLRFHISPQSTCAAAKQSCVKWHSSLQSCLLAAIVKLAQHFSFSSSSCDRKNNRGPNWPTWHLKNSIVQPLLKRGRPHYWPFVMWFSVDKRSIEPKSCVSDAKLSEALENNLINCVEQNACVEKIKEALAF